MLLINYIHFFNVTLIMFIILEGTVLNCTLIAPIRIFSSIVLLIVFCLYIWNSLPDICFISNLLSNFKRKLKHIDFSNFLS